MVAVSGGPMADVEHDHRVLGVIDLIQHPPVAAGVVDPGQLRAKRLANPPWNMISSWTTYDGHKQTWTGWTLIWNASSR